VGLGSRHVTGFLVGSSSKTPEPSLVALTGRPHGRGFAVAHLASQPSPAWSGPPSVCSLDQNPDRDDDVRRLSPLGHNHINLLGRYQFSATDLLDGSLRPLRDPAAPET